MGEIGEIFTIFGSDDNAGHLSILDLEFAIKTFGINLTGEEMQKLINKERELRQLATLLTLPVIFLLSQKKDKKKECELLKMPLSH